MENQQALLTRKEVAEKLKVSSPTLKRWRDTGILKGIKIGGSIRYYQSDVENLLNPKPQQNG